MQTQLGEPLCIVLDLEAEVLLCLFLAAVQSEHVIDYMVGMSHCSIKLKRMVTWR